MAAVRGFSSTIHCSRLPVGLLCRKTNLCREERCRLCLTHTLWGGLWYHTAPHILNLRVLCSLESQNSASLPSDPSQGAGPSTRCCWEPAPLEAGMHLVSEFSCQILHLFLLNLLDYGYFQTAADRN